MIRVITYGTFDLMHEGHINLLRRARELGDYLIVGVTSDLYDYNRGKLNVSQSLAERIENVRKTGLADQIIVEEYDGQKVEDIQKYGADIFTVGSDWAGHFNYLSPYCRVVYLDRTQGISSTQLRSERNPVIRIGLVGLDNPTERFISEAACVSGIRITHAWSEDQGQCRAMAAAHGLTPSDSIGGMDVDAVYITGRVDCHMACIKEALRAGFHVLCESPLVSNSGELKRVTEYAKERGLVVMEAVKTAFFPAYKHLILLIRSGFIGKIKDIDVSFSQVPSDLEERVKNRYNGSLYDLISYVMLPIWDILGEDYTDVNLFSHCENGFDLYTRGIIRYSGALASFKTGKGIKTEGSLIITGVDGYVYVPAPWWQTDYFEIRYEDIRSNRRYFYKYEGSGLRYELLEFAGLINGHLIENGLYPFSHTKKSVGLLDLIQSEKQTFI